MYNVKVSEYLESTEVVYYDIPITGHEKEKDTILIERNDELYEVYSFIAFDVKEKKPKQDVNPYRSFYVSFNRTKNKIYNYARDNKWDWFITFTFDPQKIDSFNYDEVVSCMSAFFLFLKHNSKTNTKYLVVPEKHKSGRYHLHGVFSDIDMSLWKFKFSGHYTENGMPIFNIDGFPFGFTTATYVESTTRVAHYIAKYITKDMFDSIKNKKRYWSTRNIGSGIHTTLFLLKEELETLLNSIGDVQTYKTVDTPYNHITYYQF